METLLELLPNPSVNFICHTHSHSRAIHTHAQFYAQVTRVQSCTTVTLSLAERIPLICSLAYILEIEYRIKGTKFIERIVGKNCNLNRSNGNSCLSVKIFSAFTSERKINLHCTIMINDRIDKLVN